MELFIRPRKVPAQNIVIRLKNRETFAYKKPGTHFHAARQFYQNVFPNFTVINVEKPPCFLRKFSPDGKHFIAFSSDQTSLEIYVYKGPAAAANLLQKTTPLYQVKTEIFERFFKVKLTTSVRQVFFSNSTFQLKYVVNVVQSTEQLNRECSLFTEDGRYVIICSAAYIPDELRPHFYQIYTNNEALTPNPRSPLEDYTLHLVDLHLGKLCDAKQFKVDKIFLSHNQGLYLYKDILAVLSVQHQVIHIFQLLDGMFVEVRKIGRFCFEDDSFCYSSVYPMERPFKETNISALKHRVLTFLYKRAANMSTNSNPYEIRRFYQYYENFKALKLWKMQLLDENHLLIKYASEEVVTLKASDANSQTSFFVVYNMIDSKVLAIYENTSEELLELFENFCDSFRNANIYTDTQFSCSPSNNIYARLIQHRYGIDRYTE